jgi:hypothetical protein
MFENMFNNDERHEVEGYPQRTKNLVHVTTKDIMKKIKQSNEMRPGKTGWFGDGIYFAESLEVAMTKSLAEGCFIEATVEVGQSLIVPKPQKCYSMNFQRLQNEYNCDSIKAFTNSGA